MEVASRVHFRVAVTGRDVDEFMVVSLRHSTRDLVGDWILTTLNLCFDMLLVKVTIHTIPSLGDKEALGSGVFDTLWLSENVESLLGPSEDSRSSQGP